MFQDLRCHSQFKNSFRSGAYYFAGNAFVGGLGIINAASLSLKVAVIELCQMFI
jgi:hypothetical protein